MSGPGSALRAEAARVLQAVLAEGRSLKAVLGRSLPGVADPRDRALLEAICFDALRHRRRYEFALSGWLARPLPRRDQAVHFLLLAGLAQLKGLGLAPHAAVGATAEAARDLGRSGLVGLVNALLRRASREALPESEDPAVAGSHPDWLVARLRADWPAQAAAILAANNQAAPLWLRANPRQGSAAALQARLHEAGLDAALVPEVPGALRLDTPVPVEALPGWEQGALSVQDGAAQLAVLALDPRPGERVLDACAAPGGKAAQLVAALGNGEVLALDVDARRLAKVSQLLHRLHLEAPNVQVRVADAAAPEGWFDGRAFDAIILDAPCSATGIIRRQPDIKWHRREADIEALAALQARLLDALWTLLKPGGRLLYATCSVLVQENAAQVQAFLERHPEAVVRPLDERFGHASGAGRQRLPGEGGMDGFFYALLARPA
ncbi:16S rRNA (cytosine(967)-C(5))-methyltransferase RsmB [Arenimonas sp.]|uniref:16S rRNA (cytosine(967)-C(5))-methyltransferase RsmB n=1 Tax=Arenimonas sp. TaxID=1872635 RepID=UPI0025EA4F75|nr:16S rRNA (cytosine(967)-C(5))-methyltransferase RsmB [Arenimonas sp.]